MAEKQSILTLEDPIMVRNARLESKGKKLWLEILLFFVITCIGSMLESALLMLPMIIGIFQTDTYQEMLASAETGSFSMDTYMDQIAKIQEELPDWLTIATLFGTAALIITVLFYCKKIEKRRLSTLGLTKKTIFPEYAMGLGIGLLMFVLVLGLNFLFGAVSFDGISFQTSMLPTLLFTFLGYMVQGASEELLCRGYFCISVSRWMPLWVGLLANSIAFALLHLGNPGVTPLALLNLFLFGVFMTVYMIRRGNLWGACAIHSVWNFAQGNLFGLQVSGTDSGASVFRCTQTEHMAIWNGGTFGPEGGLCVTFVLIAAILLVWVFGKNQNAGQTADQIPGQTALPEYSQETVYTQNGGLQS